jgi:hypothetical protein
VATLALAALAVAAGHTPASRVATARAPALTERWTRVVGARPQYVVADDADVITVTAAGRVSDFGPAGERRWVTSLDLRRDEGVGAGRAALGAGVVVVPVDESRVVAIDRASGAERWSVSVPAVRATAAGSDDAGTGIVLASDRGGRLLAFEGQTGELRWSLELSDLPADGSPLPAMWVRDGRVVVSWTTAGKGSRLLVADAATGTVAWQRDAPGWSGIPAVTTHAITLAENGEVDGRRVVSGTVTCLDLATGGIRWIRHARPDGAYLPDLAAVAGRGLVAVLDYRGTVRAFSLHDGRPMWTWKSRRRQLAAVPQVAGPLLALTVLGAEELAVGLEDGAPARIEGLEGPQTSVTIDAAATAGRRLYLLLHANADRAGELRAFEAASREPRTSPLH